MKDYKNVKFIISYKTKIRLIIAGILIVVFIASLFLASNLSNLVCHNEYFITQDVLCLELGYTNESVNPALWEKTLAGEKAFACIDNNSKLVNLIYERVTSNGYIVVNGSSIRLNEVCV